MQQAPDSLINGFSWNVGIDTLKRFAQAFYQNNIAVALALGKELTRRNVWAVDSTAIAMPFAILGCWHRAQRVAPGLLCLFCWGRKGQPRPRRLRWRNSLLKYFGVDPLIDRNGQPMKWVRREKPLLSSLTA